jgi:hypothetical protein
MRPEFAGAMEPFQGSGADGMQNPGFPGTAGEPWALAVKRFQRRSRVMDHSVDFSARVPCGLKSTLRIGDGRRNA